MPTGERRRFRVRGVVQGVGLPAVRATASRARHGLGGFVLNDGDGVVIEVEGEPRALDAFAAALARRGAAARARRRRDARAASPPRGERGLRDRRERGRRGATRARPARRRHLRRLPARALRPGRPPLPLPVRQLHEVRAALHDRARASRTTGRTRRWPASRCAPTAGASTRIPPTAASTPSRSRCPACGPRLSMPLERGGRRCCATARSLAVKGLGGYHLACDAADEDAVARLRARKQREEKPFAVMTPSPDALAELDDGGARAAPLAARGRSCSLRRRAGRAGRALGRARDRRGSGVMLPVHAAPPPALRRPRPAARADERQPLRRADRVRRRRGARARSAGSPTPSSPTTGRSTAAARTPSSAPPSRSAARAATRPPALPLPVAAPRPIVAAGAELKSTFCVARGGEAFLSPHLGDLDSEPAYRAFRADLELYLAMLGVEPEVVAHDLHPEYLSTKWALEQDAELVGVQHHHAHAAACLAEHGEDGPGARARLRRHRLRHRRDALGRRAAALRPRAGSSGSRTSSRCRCPGGEAAIREPWRVAAVHLERAGPAGAVGALAARPREPEARTRRSRPGWGACSTRSPRCSASASG